MTTNRYVLLWGGVVAVFGPDVLTDDTELTAGQIAERMAPWLAEHRVEVERMIGSRPGLSQSPVFILRRVLKTVGLKLARRQVMRDRERFMLYGLDQKARDRLVTAVQAWLDQQE